VTGNVEGQWAIQKGQLLSLSEQELVDCDSLDNGCNGGLPSNAYESIMNMGGLELETDYPYDGKDEKCHFDKSEVQAKVTGALNITTDEDGMARWLTKNGPISIGINANAMQVKQSWNFLFLGFIFCRNSSFTLEVFLTL
jgi:cathepsin F